jgi:hypothetical protein
MLIEFKDSNTDLFAVFFGILQADIKNAIRKKNIKKNGISSFFTDITYIRG